MSKYILTHDLGTSGNKATLYSTDGKITAFCLHSYPTHYPGHRCVEQSPDDWWVSVCKSSREILRGISPSDIACVTFSGQMMGCVLADAEGNALRNAIIWADSRAEGQEAYLRIKMDPSDFYRITGHRPAAFYSLAKLLWVKDNEPHIFQATHKMLNAKDYIVRRMTGIFVTDYSDASGTNLLDLEKKCWSVPIMEMAGISPHILPELRASTDIVGYVTKDAAADTGLLEGTPVIPGGGDGSCAAVGAGAVREGATYAVIGSSSWISNVSRTPIYDKAQKMFNWASLDKDYYNPCGTMQAAGYSVNWLKDTICQSEITEAAESGRDVFDIIGEKASAANPGADGLVFLPYLLGERAPRWNARARGGFLGLVMTHSKADMMRAVLEGVGYNLKLIFELINRAGSTDKITVIGGGAKSEHWLQILADIWEVQIEIPAYTEEATSLGAAICAGVGLGVYDSFDKACECNPIKKVISPRPANALAYREMYRLFDELYTAIKPLYDTWPDLKSNNSRSV